MLTPNVAQVLANVSIYLALGLYGITAIAAAIISMLLPIETSGRALPETLQQQQDPETISEKEVQKPASRSKLNGLLSNSDADHI